MAFEFKKKESARKAVKRLTRRRIEKALGSLEHCNKLEAVHEVRKDIKQLRALLRLVRPSMSRSTYRRCSASYRDAAGSLSAARDAHVKVSALAGLINHFKQEIVPGSFRTIKEVLSKACRKEQAQFSRRSASRRVGRLLKSALRDIRLLKLKQSGWSALGPGIKRTYGAGRRNFHLAQESGTAEDFHEWRKRVKDLYYQMGLLCPIWPEQMGAAESELKRLGEFLGDAHDLSILVEPAMIKRFKKSAEQDVEALKGLVEERQKQLRAQALILGGRFYEEKPSAFCKRLGQYWKRWRHEPKRAVQTT